MGGGDGGDGGDGVGGCGAEGGETVMVAATLGFYCQLAEKRVLALAPGRG